MRTSKKNVLRLVSFVLAIVSLATWMSLQTPTGIFQTASSQSMSKDDMTGRMMELDERIGDIKKQLAQRPKDQTLKNELAAAQAEYESISSQMGGDRASFASKAQAAAGTAPTGILGGLGVIPPAPPGCTVSTTSATQSTPVAIPTGPAVVSSTLLVAGAGTVIFDLNLQTTITHTFAADLDITLMSPAGTVVTLTTDNGAGNDNVFNGTIWDDSANPLGQVPYVTNAGLVTDHPYVNLTLASPLVPEENMAAFNGEDPNGTWTITISDDLAGDGGSLDNWSLEISTLPAAPTTQLDSATNSTPVAIPTGPAVVSSTLAFASTGTSIVDVNLTTNLTHTFAADLDITLTSPAGTVVTLTTDNGAGNDNVFNGTLWDDDANPAGQVPYVTNAGLATDHPYVNLTTATPLDPEEAMGAFISENPNGIWTITISDDLAGDGGSLDSWTLDITTGTCAAAACTITCPANVTQSNDPDQCGAVVNYPAPTTTGDCGTVTCSPSSGSFFPVGTTTVNCSTTAGPSCSFTVTVNDTQPPTITCPANVVGVTAQSCNAVSGTVTFPPPVATDNCPGVTTMCTPPSGSVFPVGTTTVTCTATDASGNTATCSFSVSLFNVCLQDDTVPTRVVLVNSVTGEYTFCCGKSSLSGIGTVTRQGCIVTLQHNTGDRRVLVRVDFTAKRGNASLQSPPGTLQCTITDRLITDNTCTCAVKLAQ